MEQQENIPEIMPIKDVEEILIACNELMILMLKRFKDGVQFDDFLSLYNSLMEDERIKKIMFDAYEGYKKIPAQAKDIDVEETCKLLAIQLSYIPIIVNSIK